MASTPLETQLEFLLLGASPDRPAPRCHVVIGGGGLRFGLDGLRGAIDTLLPRDVIAYVVPLDTPPLHRLLTLATLPLRVRRAERTIQRAGLRVVARLGVDPRLDAPALVYQLNSTASRYADRWLRPYSPAPALRNLLAKWSGCDPTIGAVVVLGGRP